MENQSIITCDICGISLKRKTLSPKEQVLCIRCGTIVGKYSKNSIQHTLALAIAGLFFFILANIYPIFTLESFGHYSTTSLISGTIVFIQTNHYELAALVFTFCILLPFLKLGILIYILLFISTDVKMPGIKRFAVIYDYIDTWSMVDIFMLAILVSFAKLFDLADLSLNIGLYAFFGLFIVNACISVTMDKNKIWNKIEKFKYK